MHYRGCRRTIEAVPLGESLAALDRNIFPNGILDELIGMDIHTGKSRCEVTRKIASRTASVVCIRLTASTNFETGSFLRAGRWPTGGAAPESDGPTWGLTQKRLNKDDLVRVHASANKENRRVFLWDSVEK